MRICLVVDHTTHCRHRPMLYLFLMYLFTACVPSTSIHSAEAVLERRCRFPWSLQSAPDSTFGHMTNCRCNVPAYAPFSCSLRPHMKFDIILWPAPPVAQRSTVMSMSVCLCVCEHISGTTHSVFAKFCACYLWPISPPLTALRYVMYFRFYSRRQSCTSPISQKWAYTRNNTTVGSRALISQPVAYSGGDWWC